MNTRLDDIVKKIIGGTPATRDDLDWISDSANVELNEVLDAADSIRQRFNGAAATACSIISVKTGACSEDCAYCSQSAHHCSGVQPTGFVSPDAVERYAAEMKAEGAFALGVVTSGRGVYNETDALQIAETIRAAKKAGIEPHASVGIMTDDRLIRILKSAGLVVAHHNLETSERFFPSICSTHTWKERYDTIIAFRRNGLKVCCGALFGLGETMADRIDLALTLRTLRVDSIPLNFLDPRPGTPLENQKKLSPETALRIISIFRFSLPDKPIGVFGGRQAVLAGRQPDIFRAGANRIMIGDYLTTSGNPSAVDRQLIADGTGCPLATGFTDCFSRKETLE